MFSRADFFDDGAQVLPKDLDNGDGDEWTDWRGQGTVNNGTQVLAFKIVQFFYQTHIYLMVCLCSFLGLTSLLS